MNTELICSLEKEIEKLEKQAKTLKDAVAVLKGDTVSDSRFEEARPFVQFPMVLSAGNRLEQLKEFIGKNGPMHTKQIIHVTRIPRGTVTAILNPSNGFYRDENGRWGLRD